MKKYVMLYALVSICTVHAAQTPPPKPSSQACSLCIAPSWQQLDESRKNFDDQWVLIGSITFRKTCIESVTLSKVNLLWHGQPLDELVASLYLKNGNEEKFMPIEENLVCDGRWNSVKQKLVFNFSKPFKLGLETTFYVVLTIPDHSEPILRNGSFSLEMRCLPQQLQHAAGTSTLSLAPDSTVSG